MGVVTKFSTQNGWKLEVAPGPADAADGAPPAAAAATGAVANAGAMPETVRRYVMGTPRA